MNSRETVASQLARWRDELINLGKGNRLLYYKATKTSTLAIREPGPATVLGRLREPGKGGWRFYLPPGDPVEAATARPDPLPPRAPDELLTSKTDAQSLGATLRNLKRRAEQEFLDKGLSVLYLGIGMLEWTDPAEPGPAQSPLLLVPVTITRDNPRQPFTLVRAEEEASINPALAVKLGNDFGIELPTLESVDELDPETILALVAASIADHPSWRVSAGVVLSIFSFHKEVMYRDLLDNEEAITDHPIIQALALGPKAETTFDFDPIPEDVLDEQAPPEQMASIMDADASQRQCIAAARDGHSFVMDGPPGTGKSQTIANLIAELLAIGKRVLFVSEKAAALDVVHKRLAAAGLGEYLLELHSHKATRKEVAQELGRALTSHPRPPRGFPAHELSTLISRRRELSGYAAAMNEVRQPLAQALHEAIGRVSALCSLPEAPPMSAPGSNLAAETFSELLDAARALARAWGPVERGDSFLWRDLAEEGLSASQQRELTGELDGAHRALARLRDATAVVAAKMGVAWRGSAADARRWFGVLEQLSERPDIPPAWLLVSSLEPITTKIDELAGLARLHGEAANALNGLVGVRWREIPPSAEPSLTNATAALRGLAPAWEPEEGLGSVRLSQIAEFLETSGPALRRANEAGAQIARAFGLQTAGITPARAAEIAHLGVAVGSPNPPEPAWINPGLLVALEQANSVLAALVGDYTARREQLTGVFTDDVLTLDLEGLSVRFETVHRGPRKLRSAYRADKRVLAGASRSGRAGKREIAKLKDACSWQHVARGLQSGEQKHSGLLGTYYQGPATDFGAVTAAIEIARRAVEVAGQDLQAETLAGQLARGGTPDTRLQALSQELSREVDAWQARATELLGGRATQLVTMPLTDVADWCESAAPGLAETAGIVANVSGLRGKSSDLASVRAALSAWRIVHDVERRIRAGLQEDEDGLGHLYDGLETDWARLREAAVWAGSLRELIGSAMNAHVADALMSTDASPHELQEAIRTWEKQRDRLVSHFRPTRQSELLDEFEVDYEEGLDLLGSMASSTGEIDEWLAYVRWRDHLSEGGLEAPVQSCVERRVAREDLPAILERSMLRRWVDDVMAADPRLRETRPEDRDRYAEEFRELDRAMVGAAVSRVMEACNARRPTTTAGQAGVILYEASKKRRHRPIRKLLEDSTVVAQELKPCFMMSPLTVSQFLPPATRFDVVIFDEASQVRPSDAVSCIYRGDSLIVAGDEHQLPPTSFFEAVGLDEGDEYVEDQLDEFESGVEQQWNEELRQAAIRPAAWFTSW